MKVLFIGPEHGRKRWVFYHAFSYLSAYIKKYMPDVEVDYVDVARFGMEKLREKYLSERHEVVAVTGLTSHYASVKEIIKFLNNNKAGNTKIFAGGAIISSYPEFMIQQLGADYYIMGEGEAAFLECLEAISSGKSLRNIRNVGFLENGKVVINESRPLISDLDELPWQDYETFNFREFVKQQNFSAQIFASRGCPYNCGFCYRIYGHTYRVRSVENVLEEMEFLIKEYKVYNIIFVDELFFSQKSRIEDFCRQMMKRKFNVTWHCGLRADLADTGILRLMHKAGCMEIGYGIESGSSEILKRMNKRTTAKQNLDAMRNTVEAGIFPASNLIIGYPGETRESIKETEDLLDRARCHAGMHFVQALPGTPLYNEVKEAGYIKDEEKYFLSLQVEIEGLPIDFTGMGKQFIENEQKRIMAKAWEYYVPLYKMYRRERFKYYLTHFNSNYMKQLPSKIIKHFKNAHAAS
jgi:radical SAM superfamily enzyme YgiQ (UPF0313 family)